jgi:hypothetical protein
MSTAAEMQLDPQLAWLLKEGGAHLSAQGGIAKQALERLSQWQRALLDQQIQLRKRSRRRFPDVQQWLWTERSLAQASDWWSATYKASQFKRCGEVVDACCGAGVDCVALAQNAKVTAMDYDPNMCALALANAAAHQQEITAECSEFNLQKAQHLAASADYMHIDPDRRPAERRTNDGDLFSPTLDEVLHCAEHFKGAMIKLAPSTRMNAELTQKADEQTTRVWLGNMGECRQQLLLTGELAGPNSGLRRAVLAEPTIDETLADRQMIATEYESHALSYAACTSTSDRFVYDLHAVLHASQLHTAWAAANDLQQLGGEHGYFTGSKQVDSPWAQCFEYLEELPWDDRKIRKWIRSANPGTVEVKNRLVRMDANAFQRRYSGTGALPLTLLVTQLGGRTRAIAARRV